MNIGKMGQKGFTIGELLIVIAIVLLISVPMVPFIKQSRARLDKVICANNLREVGLAMYMYAKEHGGQFPPAIKTLYDEKYISDTKLLDCPAANAAGSLENPEYVYTPGLTIKSPSLEPLLQDKTRNHPQGGKNALYVNGNVAWVAE